MINGTMKARFPIILFLCIAYSSIGYAQNSLPEISIKGFQNKVIISWLNDYEKPVTDIFIQRSFDSLKNFTTIGSVLIPQNKENGFPDNNPPYNRMYYRVSISFEGGTYEIGPSFKADAPVKELASIDITDTTTKIGFDFSLLKSVRKDLILTNPALDSANNQVITNPKVTTNVNAPSNRIFINRQNSLTLHLPNAEIKNYTVKFFDENEVVLFELNHLTEDYLIMEKVNFGHSGWFSFEIYEDNKLIEKNKFFIAKDVKPNNR